MSKKKDKPLNRFDDYRSWKNPLVRREFIGDMVGYSMQDITDNALVAISHYLDPKEEKERLKAVNFILKNCRKDVLVTTSKVNNVGAIYGILQDNQVLVIRGFTITRHKIEDLIVLEM